MDQIEGVRRTLMGVYVLADDIGFSRYIGNLGRLDTDAHEEIVQFASHIPVGGVVINAGAALGDHVEVYSRLVGRDGHVFAFEPHPGACAALAANMARVNNVTVVGRALGYEAGPNILFESVTQGCSAVLPGGASASGETVLADYTRVPLVQVPITVTTLDICLLPVLTRCDLVHLDMEGTEWQALLGAQELIRRFRPTIVVEIGQTHLTRWGLTPEKVLELLSLLGYTVSDLNTINSEDIERHGRVWNVLATPIPGFIAPTLILSQQ